MVIDTSAIVAISFDEPEADAFTRAIGRAPVKLMSAANVLELSMVIEASLDDEGTDKVDNWLHRAGIEIVSVDLEQLTFARHAWRQFGKGRHPAALNFGDCFAYALAKARSEPLLFKGNDFARTDVLRVAFDDKSRT